MYPLHITFTVYWQLHIYILLPFIIPVCSFCPVIFEEKNSPSNSEITAGTIFECLKCGRTSGTWLIFSSLLLSLIYIRKFVSLFPFFFFYPVPTSDMVYYHDGSFFSGLDWWSAVITFTFIRCKSLGSLSLSLSDGIQVIICLYFNNTVD